MSRLPLLDRIILLAAALLVAEGAAAQPVPAPPPPATTLPQSPSKGDVVPVFETLGMDGKPWRMDFPKGSKTVLLFFLSGCPHCHRMIPEWNRAYERRPKDLKVVGVIMDPDQAPASFWATTSIVFPVLRSPGHEFLRGLNVNRAPLTLRVGEGGRIEDLGLGEIDLIRLGELFKPVK
jgi:peroxiredoxin